MIYLLEIGAFTGSAVETLRFASHTYITSPTDAPANTTYRGRIMDAGMLRRSVSLRGEPSASLGFGLLNNADGALDALYGYGYGREFVLKEIAGTGAALASAGILARGIVEGVDSANPWTELRLRARDQLALLRQPLLTERYAGTTTAPEEGVEGNVDLKGRIKPHIYGSVTNVAPLIVNQFLLVYQVSANAVSSIVVYDGGVALTDAGNFTDLETFLAAQPDPGEYVTLLAMGLFLLGGRAVFTVTADVVEGAVGERSAARLVERMLSLPSMAGLTLDGDSFDVLHAFNGAEVGIVVEDTSAEQAVTLLLASIGGALAPDSEGKIRALALAEPSGDPEATFTIRDQIGEGSFQFSAAADESGGGPPAWSIIVNWGRIWQTMNDGQLAGSVSPGQRLLLASATRQSTAQDCAIKAAHPLAPELTFDTLLTTQVDAEAEAARLLAMHGERRDRLTLTVPDTRGRLELGAVVSVDFPRLGYDGGKLMRLIGRTDDFTKRQIQLELWG
jgi:hypothetical protein